MLQVTIHSIRLQKNTGVQESRLTHFSMCGLITVLLAFGFIFFQWDGYILNYITSVFS